MKNTIRTVTVVLAASLAGCTWLGPEMIRSGRPAYNDAILTTSDQQLLQNIVRIRFGDSIGLLSVSSVTANVALTSTGTVNLGFGPSANYVGNLVPFSGTLTAEQNPTISYTPVNAENMMRQFGAEIPLDLAILTISYAYSREAAWLTIVRRVNNLRNPDFPEPPVLTTDPRFREIASLAARLQSQGTLYWVRLPGPETGFAIVLHSYSPHSSREVARLIDLFGIPAPTREGDDVIIPVRLSVGSPEPGAIAIETRTLFDLMRLAAAGIELPADAVGAMRFPERGLAGQAIRIRVADAPPPQSRVAVAYRDRWYYIADDDESSKHWFTLLQLLASAQTPATAVAPTLTIPVSGRK